MKGKKKTRISLWICLCLLVSLLAACKEPEVSKEQEVQQDEVVQTAYKEFVYGLDFLDGNYLQDICRLEDESLRMVSSTNQMYRLPAGKKEWTEESYEDPAGWYEKEGVMTRLAKNGSWISYTIAWEGDKQILEYLYMAEDGDTIEGSADFEENEYFIDFYLSGNGEAYCKCSGGIYRMNLERGVCSLLIERDGESEVFFYDNMIYMPSTKGMYIYDLAAGEQLAQNKVLDDFLTLKGNDAKEMYVFSVCLMVDEEENLFFLFPDGFYRYSKDGTAVEQIFEADITEDGILQAALCRGIYQTGQEKFEMFYGDGTRRVYGTHIVKEPDVILTLYRLQNESDTDDDLKKAIKKYEELHPEVRIQYVIGMQQADTVGMTREDVIRNLNLDLAAGAGPDLLITDGLPAESYIKQGIFEDISPIVRRVDEKEGLLPQVTRHYEEQDGAVYRIPLGFTLNAVWGPESILGDGETVTLKQFTENYTAYYENQDNWPSQSGGSLESTMDSGYFAETGWWSAALPNMNFMISQLASSCIGAWVTEDGKLNEGAIEEYLVCLKEILETEILQYTGNEKYLEYEAENPGASLFDWGIYLSTDKDVINEIQTKPSSDMHIMNRGTHIYTSKWVPVREMYLGGEIGNLGENTPSCYMMHNMEVVPGSVWKLFEGQTSHNFVPRKTIGVVNHSKHRQEAEDFLEFLLSAESAGEKNKAVFSVNKTVLDKNFEDFRTFSYDNVQIDCTEYIERVKKEIDNLETPAPEYPELLNAVALEGVRYIREECTIEEAMENIRKRMELVMAE